MQFFIENMTCGGCARSVTRIIQSIDPDAKVATDPLTRGVQVQTRADDEEIAQALREAGYPPSPT